jgi:hypothetical protein
MRTATRLLHLGYVSAATFTVGVQPTQAQISVEPLVGWTWEGQYHNWVRSDPSGHSRINVKLSPALTFGARASVPIGIGSTHLAVAYAHSRPEVTVAYDYLVTGPGFSSSSFGSVDSDAATHKLGLELTYAGPRLPRSLEIGGSVFARSVRADTGQMPNSAGNRTYRNWGASMRTSIGSGSGRWGAPRLALEIGAIRGSGRVGIDVLSLFTTADPAPQWAPFVNVSGSWRIRL